MLDIINAVVVVADDSQTDDEAGTPEPQ